MSENPCPFCDYAGPNEIEERYLDPRCPEPWAAQRDGHVLDCVCVFAVKPLREAVPGHMLLIPRRHVRWASDDPYLTGKVFEATALWMQTEYLGSAVNLITSEGAEATQTVWHLHVHVIPRRKDDGVALPWTKHAEVGAE